MSTDASQAIIGLCDEALRRHANNCSGLVKEVSEKCGVLLMGMANEIVDIITSSGAGWMTLANGSEAATAARSGMLVVGGLKASPNGHVVVVVNGPVKDGKYPYCYSGRYQGMKGPNGQVVNVGFTRGHGSVTAFWKHHDCDNVHYAAIKPVQFMLNSSKPEGYKDLGLIQF